MMKWLMLVLAMVLCVTGASAQQAEPAKAAQRIYAEATPENMIKAMLRAQALDATDPAVQEDYILLNECKLFLENSRDDFKMNKLRKAVLQVIERDRGSWPDAFQFVTPLQLDKYNFDQSAFMLSAKSQLKNVNSFAIMNARRDVCQQGRAITRLPAGISIRIDQPVTITSIPLNEKQGEQLLQHMLDDRNTARQIFARFNMAATYMPPVDIKNDKSDSDRYIIDGKLSSIEFFEDRELTKPIWTYIKD